jgi:hypothetical protein
MKADPPILFERRNFIHLRLSNKTINAQINNPKAIGVSTMAKQSDSTKICVLDTCLDDLRNISRIKINTPKPNAPNITEAISKLGKSIPIRNRRFMLFTVRTLHVFDAATLVRCPKCNAKSTINCRRITSA